jgi:hypothetical protein
MTFKNNHRGLISSSSLQSVRQEVKQTLISDTVLCEEDFYPGTESHHIPRKLILKKLVNFHQIFNKEDIAGFISNAHQKDESFSRITQACQFILSNASAQFSGLLILASGSGQLAAHLSSELNESHTTQISHQMVGVDISHNMSTQGAALLSKVQNGVSCEIVYRAVTADCASFDRMASKIPELSQEVPLLTISHGGARYFAQGRVKDFLESVAAFPKGSRVVITEVGAEIHQLMYDLACQADSMPTLDVLTFPSLSSYSSCWNLTYYYFLHQHYHHSSVFRSYIDKLLQADYLAIMDQLQYNSYIECLNAILLEIAGTRKQAVHLLELHCRSGQE